MQINTKQKALLVLTIAAFGYLGYQVYGLVKSDMGSVTNSGPVPVANAAEPSALSNRRVVTPSEVQDVQETPTYVKTTPLASGQKAYLHMVNQYELAKMKRRLLEEKAAIAAAQHRIATLNKQTREIDNSLAGTPETYNDTEDRHMGPFLLSYIDRQNGKWSATLNRDGRYYQVHTGSVLSDGSKIVEINRQGVTLKKDNKEERITFNGIIKITAKKTANANAIKPQDKPVLSKIKKKSEKQPSHAKVQSAAPHKLQSPKPVLSDTPHQTPVHLTEDERRILAMPKNTYSIQLIGSYHRDIVENFAIANDLGDRAIQLYVLNRGKRWYVLLYGNYPNRSAAQKALNNLPPNLTPENPWIRAIAPVQQDIRQEGRLRLTSVHA